MNTKNEDLKTLVAIVHEQKKPFKCEFCKGTMETLSIQNQDYSLLEDGLWGCIVPLPSFLLQTVRQKVM